MSPTLLAMQCVDQIPNWQKAVVAAKNTGASKRYAPASIVSCILLYLIHPTNVLALHPPPPKL